jgi:hypothetical protein
LGFCEGRRRPEEPAQADPPTDEEKAEKPRRQLQKRALNAILHSPSQQNRGALSESNRGKIKDIIIVLLLTTKYRKQYSTEGVDGSQC